MLCARPFRDVAPWRVLAAWVCGAGLADTTIPSTPCRHRHGTTGERHAGVTLLGHAGRLWLPRHGPSASTGSPATPAAYRMPGRCAVWQRLVGVRRPWWSHVSVAGEPAGTSLHRVGAAAHASAPPGRAPCATRGTGTPIHAAQTSPTRTCSEGTRRSAWRHADSRSCRRSMTTSRRRRRRHRDRLALQGGQRGCRSHGPRHPAARALPARGDLATLATDYPGHQQWCAARRARCLAHGARGGAVPMRASLLVPLSGRRACIGFAIALGVVAVVLGVRPGVPPAARAAVSVTFTSTGSEQTFVVPAGVTSLHVVVVGAPGGQGGIGGGAGGKGAVVTADIAVTPGQTLYIEVGGAGGDGAFGGAGGFNGGGNGGLLPPFVGGGGGGASDVRTVSSAQPNSLASRLVVAAGGGGGGGDSGNGGGKGGDAGQPGAPGAGPSPSGGGGAVSLTGGGTGGAGGGAPPGQNGGNGSLGAAGRGGDGLVGGGGGGGGGGCYGGGGGGGSGNGGGGGGGGASSCGYLNGTPQAVFSAVDASG